MNQCAFFMLCTNAQHKSQLSDGDTWYVWSHPAMASLSLQGDDSRRKGMNPGRCNTASLRVLIKQGWYFNLLREESFWDLCNTKLFMVFLGHWLENTAGMSSWKACWFRITESSRQGQWNWRWHLLTEAIHHCLLALGNITEGINKCNVTYMNMNITLAISSCVVFSVAAPINHLLYVCTYR